MSIHLVLGTGLLRVQVLLLLHVGAALVIREGGGVLPKLIDVAHSQIILRLGRAIALGALELLLGGILLIIALRRHKGVEIKYYRKREK